MSFAAGILERAGHLLKDGSTWGTHHLAVDAKGKPCCPLSPKAVKWDAIGAVLKCGRARPSELDHKQSTAQALCALDYAAAREFGATSIRVNDEMGHAAVMLILRRAWFEQSTPEERKEAA